MIPSNGTGNTLIIFGSLTGIAFIVVGGVVALAFTDGKNAPIILPVMLGLMGPLITSIIALSRSIENGNKVDTSIQQNVQIAQLVKEAQAAIASPPTPQIVVTAPPPVVVHDIGTGDTPSGAS